MRGVDEPREPVRAAVGRVRRAGVDAVVAPAALAGERRDRHQLDRGDAELAQRREVRDRAVEGALAREGADVELVDHELVERSAVPAASRPGERARVDDARRARARRRGCQREHGSGYSSSPSMKSRYSGRAAREMPLNIPSSPRPSGCEPSAVCTARVRAWGAQTVSSTVPSQYGTVPSIPAGTPNLGFNLGAVSGGCAGRAPLASPSPTRLTDTSSSTRASAGVAQTHQPSERKLKRPIRSASPRRSGCRASGG